MFDQRLWNTHIHLREQQLMQEAANDRLADEHQRAHGIRGPLSVALRHALAVFQTRISAARATTRPAATQPLIAEEQATSILAEAENIVRLRWTSAPNAPCDCTCDAG